MAEEHVPKPASAAGTPQRAAPPEPSFAERVRTLLHVGRIGSLSTQSRRHPGHPFGSVVSYGVLPDGSPTLLLSSLAVHTENLLADPHASLLVVEPGAESEALARGRATLVGRIEPIDQAADDAVREDYLARHAIARGWVGFRDFAFYRLDVASVYYVAGFGVMGWVEQADYRRAEPDPLSDSAPGILAHMNADHADALVLYCRVFAGVEVERAEMLAVDRLGFRVRAETPEGPRPLRIAFTRPASTPEETRKVLVEMVRDARARAAPAK
jgi:putative heme iron utilization protein